MRFTVRRPPTGEVSPCCHRPSGGDVACSVDVGVAPSCIAGFALENRLALAISRSDVPARGATLRRIRGRNLLDPTKSLVLQTRGQKAPTAAADSSVEPTLLGDSRTGLFGGAARGAGHRPHVKGFNPDRVKATCNVSGHFFDPVLASIDLTCLQLRDRPLGLLAAVRAMLGSGETLLQRLQPLRLTPTQAGCVQQFTGGQSRRHGNPAVDTDHPGIARAGDRSRDVGERDMPAPGPITGHPVRLNTCWYRSRQAKPHPAHFRHPHPAKAAVQPLDVTRFHPDLPKPLMHTRFAPRRAAVCAGEEVPHSLGEVPQRLLLHRLTPGAKPGVLRAGFRQLRGLLAIAGSFAARLPVLLLLHRQIPHIPRVPAVPKQCLLLLRSRQQSEPRHTSQDNRHHRHSRRSATASRRGSTYPRGLGVFN